MIWDIGLDGVRHPFCSRPMPDRVEGKRWEAKWVMGFIGVFDPIFSSPLLPLLVGLEMITIETRMACWWSIRFQQKEECTVCSISVLPNIAIADILVWWTTCPVQVPTSSFTHQWVMPGRKDGNNTLRLWCNMLLDFRLLIVHGWHYPGPTRAAFWQTCLFSPGSDY